MPVDIESLIPFRVNDGEYSVNLPLTHLKQGLQGMSPDGHTPIVVPDYQRGRVWTAAQQRAYIEAKLCKNISLHFDVIRLNCPIWGGRDEPVIGLDPNVLELVDGLQRLTAGMVFTQDQLPVLGGYVASDLINYRMHTSFTIQVNTLPTRARCCSGTCNSTAPALPTPLRNWVVFGIYWHRNKQHLGEAPSDVHQGTHFPRPSWRRSSAPGGRHVVPP
jgi:hypothetical protein